MFNLLMFNVDWSSRRVTVPMGRMFEFTDNDVADLYRDDNGPVFERLTSLPCLFCEEGVGAEPAWVGEISRARVTGKEVSLEIVFDPDVPQLENGLLWANRVAVDMPNNFEFSRNHWAIKDRDLYRFLLSTIRPRRQRPTVFQIPEHEHIEPALVSVMMPFAAEFTPVYQAIRQAAEGVGLVCRRADDIWENPTIIQDVVGLIDRSRIVVCDCTGRNPNVFYEAGIAHTLGREVILITQSEADIPFDLRHLRQARYHDNGEGRAALTTALQNRMAAIIGH